MHCPTWLNFNLVLGFIINQGPFFKICAPRNDRSHPLHLPNECPLCLMPVLMSLCSWWKCGSYLSVLEKETEVRTTVPASDLDHSLVLLGFTMFDCTSPALLVLGTWTRTFIHTPLMVHTPPRHNTLGEQWHWPDRGIWLIVTKQSKRSPMSGPGPWPH